MIPEWGRPLTDTESAAMSHDAFASLLAPGSFVRHPGEPDWGIGQVQSVVGSRVTVNFEHAGKRTINIAVIDLDMVDAAELNR